MFGYFQRKMGIKARDMQSQPYGGLVNHESLATTTLMLPCPPALLDSHLLESPPSLASSASSSSSSTSPSSSPDGSPKPYQTAGLPFGCLKEECYELAANPVEELSAPALEVHHPVLHLNRFRSETATIFASNLQSRLESVGRPLPQSLVQSRTSKVHDPSSRKDAPAKSGITGAQTKQNLSRATQYPAIRSSNTASFDHLNKKMPTLGEENQSQTSSQLMASNPPPGPQIMTKGHALYCCTPSSALPTPNKALAARPHPGNGNGMTANLLAPPPSLPAVLLAPKTTRPKPQPAANAPVPGTRTRPVRAQISVKKPRYMPYNSHTTLATTALRTEHHPTGTPHLLAETALVPVSHGASYNQHGVSSGAVRPAPSLHLNGYNCPPKPALPIGRAIPGAIVPPSNHIQVQPTFFNGLPAPNKTPGQHLPFSVPKAHAQQPKHHLHSAPPNPPALPAQHHHANAQPRVLASRIPTAIKPARPLPQPRALAATARGYKPYRPAPSGLPPSNEMTPAPARRFSFEGRPGTGDFRSVAAAFGAQATPGYGKVGGMDPQDGRGDAMVVKKTAFFRRDRR